MDIFYELICEIILLFTYKIHYNWILLYFHLEYFFHHCSSGPTENKNKFMLLPDLRVFLGQFFPFLVKLLYFCVSTIYFFYIAKKDFLDELKLLELRIFDGKMQMTFNYS